ncbi:interferon alpha-21-like [Megalops cyprinoides]|uniref:interferon alpha-21-like n=1 Tax=Megalops cyprinoides TaxID=118141 RepID=UPI001864207F|nr:interferon alpha-21-like [Megalops cyprinoides]
MAHLKLLSACLILFILCHTLSTTCQWTQFKLVELNNKCIQLLKDMGGNFPIVCLKENIKLKFPEGVYRLSGHTQDDIAFIAYEALNYVAKIFSNNMDSTTWNNKKIRLFKNLLHRQVENLEECVRSEMPFSGDGSFPAANMILKEYFEELGTLLKDKGWRLCAWEIVRKEVRHNLEQLKMFLERRGRQ